MYGRKCNSSVEKSGDVSTFTFLNPNLTTFPMKYMTTFFVMASCLLLLTAAHFLVYGTVTLAPSESHADLLAVFDEPYNSSSIELTMNDIAAAIDQPLHPLHQVVYERSNRSLSVWYGYSTNSWCKIGNPEANSLPSLLRLLDFHVEAQMLVRAMFLCSMLLKPLMTYMVGTVVLLRLQLALYTSPAANVRSLLVAAAVAVAPIVHAAQLVMGAIMTLWHSQIDFPSIYWFPVYAFCGLSLLHMVLYTAIAISFWNGKQVLLRPRCTCIGFFAVTAPVVLQWHSSSFETSRLCHSHVPISAAICEYLCGITLVVFSCLEWKEVAQFTGFIDDYLPFPSNSMSQPTRVTSA